MKYRVQCVVCIVASPGGSSFFLLLYYFLVGLVNLDKTIARYIKRQTYVENVSTVYLIWSRWVVSIQKTSFLKI